MWLHSHNANFSFPYQRELSGVPSESQLRLPLPRDAQLGEIGPDLIEDRDELGCGGQEEVLAVAACAGFQQRRLWVAVGADLYGVDRDAGGLDVVARDLLPCIDRRFAGRVSVGIPAVRGVQTVSEQDDDVLICVIWIFRRDRERGAGQRLPSPDQ